MVTPVMHESPEWDEVQKRLQAIELGQAQAAGELRRVNDKQDAQHRANKEDIQRMELAIFGNPLDVAGTPGLQRNVDTILTYAKATKFWAKVAVALLGLLLSYVAAKDSLIKVSGIKLPTVFSLKTFDSVYANSKHPSIDAGEPPAYIFNK